MGDLESEKEQDDFLDVLSVYNPAELVCGVSDDFYRQLTSFCSSRLGSCLVTRMPETDETCKAPAIAESIEDENVRMAFGYLADYLQNVMRDNLPEFHSVQPIREDHTLILSDQCIRNLEITRNMRDGGRRGTLLELLDHTHTAMGARLLRRWLERPLVDVNGIILRQDGIEELTNHAMELTQLEELLSQVLTLKESLAVSKPMSPRRRICWRSKQRSRLCRRSRISLHLPVQSS